MHIPPELIIHQTRHWTLNQRIDSALPGYCMLGSRQPATAFHQLPEQALAEFGPLLARVEREMDALLRPRRIYVGRYGHMPGLPVHFHLIPLYDWVETVLGGHALPDAPAVRRADRRTPYRWRRADPVRLARILRTRRSAGRARHGSATGDRRIAPGIRLRRPTPNIVWAGLRVRAGRMTACGWVGSEAA